MSTQLPSRRVFLANGILEEVKCALCKEPFDDTHKVSRIYTATHNCRYVFGSTCIYDYFANRANNQCPECHIPLFTMPRTPNFKPGGRVDNGMPLETWNQAPSDAQAYNTADMFNFRHARDFVRLVWENVYELQYYDDIYESDIEGGITQALEAIWALDPVILMRPVIRPEHRRPVKAVVKEMIEEQFERFFNGEAISVEVLDAWIPRMGAVLEWNF